MTYLASLFGMARIPQGYGGVDVALYTPLHVLIFLAAVLIVWKGPESWVFTRRLHLPRVAAIMTILALAVIMMWSQNENYFIYFRF